MCNCAMCNAEVKEEKIMKRLYHVRQIFPSGEERIYTTFGKTKRKAKALALRLTAEKPYTVAFVRLVPLEERSPVCP